MPCMPRCDSPAVTLPDALLTTATPSPESELHGYDRAFTAPSVEEQRPPRRLKPRERRMRTLSSFVGCIGLLFLTALVAADPPYAGRWKVNEDKSDYGPAFNFAREESGALRLTEGDRSYIVRFDGKEYPHPLGGVVRWTRIDDRSWEMTLTQN